MHMGTINPQSKRTLSHCCVNMVEKPIVMTKMENGKEKAKERVTWMVRCLAEGHSKEGNDSVGQATSTTRKRKIGDVSSKTIAPTLVAGRRVGAVIHLLGSAEELMYKQGSASQLVLNAESQVGLLRQNNGRMRVKVPSLQLENIKKQKDLYTRTPSRSQKAMSKQILWRAICGEQCCRNKYYRKQCCG